MPAFFEGQREKLSDGTTEVTLLESPKARGERRIVRFMQFTPVAAGAAAQASIVRVYRGATPWIAHTFTSPAINQHERWREIIVLEGEEDMRITLETTAGAADDLQAIVVYGQSRSR